MPSTAEGVRSVAGGGAPDVPGTRRRAGLSVVVMVAGVVAVAIGIVLTALVDFAWVAAAVAGAVVAVAGGVSALVDAHLPRREVEQPDEVEQSEQVGQVGQVAATSATSATSAALPPVRVLSDAATEQDEFDRGRYVEALADIALRADTPLVVALHGSWGSGKTSLMYQIRRRLDPNHDGTRPEQRGAARARTVWFDPWMHQFDQAPAIALLHATTEQLGLAASVEAKETLKRIGLALAEDIRIPYLGLHLGKLATIRSEMANDEFRRREQQARLRAHFHQLLRLAGAPRVRLVFFIDDLDRCQPKRTVEILEALKLYLDFPGCVYVLGVDREPLEAAIKSEYQNLQITESSYLDKIVQLPFSLPAISEDAMRRFVTDRVPPELREVTEILVTAGADDPRQVKRILNSLLLNHRLVPTSLGADYEPPILTAVILIQNLAAELYRQLRLNPPAMYELFRGASGDLPAATPDEAAARPKASLWEEHVAARPRLAAALRLVSVPADLDLRPYFTLTAAVAAPVQPAPPSEPHALRFTGPGGLAGLIRVDSAELGSIVSSARAALRRAVEAEQAVRVREPAAPNPTDLLLRLLPRLAVVGYRVYDTVFRPLSPAEEDALAGVVKQPGILPIVQAAPDTRALPAAILYDQPIDTALAPSDYRLCPVFVEALETPSDPAETPCWQGACPASADQRTVCPSGFWGFRHALGHPFPTGADAGADPAPAVPYEGCPDIVVGFDQGMQMPLAEEHLRELARGCDAWPASHWWQATDLPSLAAALRTTHPHLVYLYAHGQTVDDVPSLRLGGPDAPPILLTDVRRNLRRTGGNGTRPIIVINSDLGGDGLAKYAAAFANDAAGVVGPEVPLLAEDAAAFGEQLVRRLVGGQTVGWAVRDARLDLLRDGSPLGLAYTPFIAPDVGLPGKPSGGAP